MGYEYGERWFRGHFRLDEATSWGGSPSVEHGGDRWL